MPTAATNTVLVSKFFIETENGDKRSNNFPEISSSDTQSPTVRESFEH